MESRTSPSSRSSARPETQRSAGLAEVLETLREIESFLDDQADADGDVTGFVPNDAMRLQIAVQRALVTINGLPEEMGRAENRSLSLGIEYGYRACEKGQNLQAALRYAFHGDA